MTSLRCAFRPHCDPTPNQMVHVAYVPRDHQRDPFGCRRPDRATTAPLHAPAINSNSCVAHLRDAREDTLYQGGGMAESSTQGIETYQLEPEIGGLVAVVQSAPNSTLQVTVHVSHLVAVPNCTSIAYFPSGLCWGGFGCKATLLQPPSSMRPA